MNTIDEIIASGLVIAFILILIGVYEGVSPALFRDGVCYKDTMIQTDSCNTANNCSYCREATRFDWVLGITPNNRFADFLPVVCHIFIMEREDGSVICSPFGCVWTEVKLPETDMEI